MEKSPADIFLQTKRMKLLIAIETPTYVLDLQRNSNLFSTYESYLKIRDSFTEAGLITQKKSGRMIILELTEEGREFARDFKILIKKLERLEWKK